MVLRRVCIGVVKGYGMDAGGLGFSDADVDADKTALSGRWYAGAG